MPIPKAELKRYRALVKTLETDLLKRAKAPCVAEGLTVAWAAEKAASRTGAPLATWTRRRCTQVAIAWILSTIFVRTLEDRGFLTRRRIAGPGASDSEDLFTQLAPFLTARDYLLTVFRELSRLPGAADVFDPRHNPVWVLAPSAAGARALLDFFRVPGKKGESPPEFDGEDTRFLGDLYQDLSEDVRKRYALLQTPEFVEEFILEQTLDPAIATFGLAETKLIDPTCGSGHFLLGAFRSLFARWQEAQPGTEPALLALKALKQVHGTDLNPYAVAIARFRLTLEFLQAAGIEKLARAPRLKLNLAVADSLLHGVAGEQQRLSGAVETGKAAWGDKLFALEDEDEALRILGQRYEAVVGNPPYITEKDVKKKKRYRDLYPSAAGLFSLAAPFTERLFGLARAAGFVGMINANSFTKRDFGRTLIQKVLAALDVRKIVDTSGAYIPGHGTPTLLLFGRNQPHGGDDVVAVLGKRGEWGEPSVPAHAPVWLEILGAHDRVGFDGRHVSVETIRRQDTATHPWVLAGGGARELMQTLEAGGDDRLEAKAEAIGFMCITKKDDAFAQPPRVLRRAGVQEAHLRPFVVGQSVRDWRVNSVEDVVFPYDAQLEVVEPDVVPELDRFLWCWRTELGNRKVFSGQSYFQAQKPWWAYGQIPEGRAGNRVLAFSFVSTHNHFVLDRGDRIFNRHAPIIKLRDEFDEADHLAILGLLNSSCVAFWCRMVMYPKSGDKVGDGARTTVAPWDRYLEYAGNLLKQLPIASIAATRPALLALVRHAERTVGQMAEFAAPKALSNALAGGAATSERLRAAESAATEELQRLEGTLVSLQEEMDWRVYGLYGMPTLISDFHGDVLVPVAPENRPFEVRLARDVATDPSARIWFKRHGRTPPTDVGGPLVDIYRRRLALIEQHKELQLLETPETKRRWPARDYGAEFLEAYRSWLLDRIESLLESSAETLSARRLAAELNRDPKALAVAEVYTGESAPDLESLVRKLIKSQGVPYLAAQRYKTTGLEKRTEWENVWKKQRDEDAGEDAGNIPVPPKYSTKDFARGEYWKHRGKLDVPKERFVLYPDANSETDDSPLAGWAGWDHLGKAQALAALYQARKNEDGWTGEQLLPLLAGLDELVPWLIQWHNEPSDAFGGLKLGDYFAGFVDTEARHWGIATSALKELNANSGGEESAA